MGLIKAFGRRASPKKKLNLKPGAKVELKQLLRELKLSDFPTRVAGPVTQFGEVLVVNVSQLDKHTYFAFERALRFDGSELLRYHMPHSRFRWTLNLGDSWDDEPIEMVHILVASKPGAPLIYVSKGRLGSYSMHGEGPQDCSYSLSDDLPMALDSFLCQKITPPGMDGIEASKLLASGVDFTSVRRLAESWLGPLPSSDLSKVPAHTPMMVRLWHQLWTELSLFNDYPWACWPAAWSPGSPVSYFQDEWQTGDIYGLHQDGSVHCQVLMTDQDEVVFLTPDMPSFALGFFLEGLLQGAYGLYLFVTPEGMSHISSKLTKLPVEAWTTHPFAPEYGPIEFVGGSGVIGTKSLQGITLRCANLSSAAKLVGYPQSLRWEHLIQVDPSSYFRWG